MEPEKISLNYLRRLSDNYNLTIEEAQKLFPKSIIVDTTLKNTENV
jgi:hypothetical protein